MKIFKYPLHYGHNTIPTPKEAKFLSVGLDLQNTPCAWYGVPDEPILGGQELMIVFTGERIPGSFQNFRGTVVHDFVYHVFSK